jgi:hypothetical protein
VKRKSCDSDEDKNTVVGLQRRACNSSNSPPQRGDKGECSRYNSAYHLVAFDLYVKMEERIHVHIAVYITIIFQNVGKE